MPTLSQKLNNNGLVTEINQNDSTTTNPYTAPKAIYTGKDSIYQNDSKTGNSYVIPKALYVGKNSTDQNDSKTALSGVSLSSDNISAMLKKQGIYTDMTYNKYQRFKRSPVIDLSEDVLRGGKEYLFITKPELNIYQDTIGTQLNPELAIQPFFLDLHKRMPRILRQLQFNISSHESPFINLLSYALVNTLDIPDINAKEMSTAANIFGTRIMYRTHSSESDENLNFNLEFKENNRAEIYYFFKAWDLYCTLKAKGHISPPSKNNIEKRILHDKVSAYKIITTETDDILFFAETFGTYPDQAPRGSFSEVPTDNGITHSVSFKADFIEDMDPQILQDFNDLVDPFIQKTKYKTSTMYNYNDNKINTSLQVVPYIIKSGEGYKLKWVGGTL